MSTEVSRKKDEIRWKLDYNEKKKELIRFLQSEDTKTMVLATSHGDRVTERTVLIASTGLDIYFFSWGHSRKCEQIRTNPRVALCKDNVQIEGVAEILGSLTNKKTRKYTDILRTKFPEAIARWEHRPGMVIARVKPVLVVIGGRGEPHLEFLDLKNKEAYAEKWAYY